MKPIIWKTWKKEQNKPKASIREEMIKIKREINKIGNNKTRKKWNKLSIKLASLYQYRQRKRHKLPVSGIKWDITTDTAGIKRIISEYY